MTIRIIEEGAFDSDVRNQINQNFLSVAAFQTGDNYYVDALHGSDQNDGLTPATAVASLLAAYTKCVDGHNDTVVLIGNGATSASARLSATFTWAKNATHLLGICSPVRYSQRARIAPTTGIAAFANFFIVSGNGCIFQNLQWFHGFTTGVAAAICMKVTGSRNAFINCQLAGMGDNESAQDTGSRNLLITSGENFFKHCTFGIDTITRTVLNSSVEFQSGAARNVFEDCVFASIGSTAAANLQLLSAAASAIDRMTVFTRCLFYNASAFSGGAASTGVAKLLASAGGALLMQDCTEYGFTDWGYDAASKLQILVSGAVPTSNTSGIAIVNT